MASEGMTFIQHYLEYGEPKFNDQDEQGQEPLPPGTITLGTILNVENGSLRRRYTHANDRLVAWENYKGQYHRSYIGAV